jgi:hypothetical protein
MASDLQLLVNWETRSATGCFRTNLGVLAMESRLRPAATQLENRQRRFGLRLLSDVCHKAEVVGAVLAIGKRLECALGYSGRTESAVLLEEPQALDADTLQEDEAAAKAEAERPKPGLAMFHGRVTARQRSRRILGRVAERQRWVGIKTHMGHNQEAYDAEYGALARALETTTGDRRS